MCKTFSLVPSKNLSPEKTEVFTVQFFNDKIYYTKKKAIWQFGKIGVLINFIIQKLKSKLSLSQFSLMTGFFEGTRENILHIFLA